MKAVMKAVAAPGLSLAEVDVPEAGPDDVLARVLAASICGTDLHIYNWDAWAQSQVKPPIVIGHECAGEVMEVGANVRRLKPGDRVAFESHIPCGSCYQCRNDMRHICDHLKILGLHRPGCFAEYVSMPEVCAWKVPASVPPEVVTLMEPMGNGVHAVHAADVRGKSVAVFGCGPTGLFAIACARAMEASAIFAVDIDRHRLELARVMGAGEVAEGADPDLTGWLVRRGGGYGVDVAFEMSGNPAAIRNAFGALKKGGTLVAFGIPSRPVEIEWSNELILKGRRVLGIVGRRMFETWETMQRLMDSGRLDPRPIITHRYPLADFETAFRALSERNSACGKALLLP
ncbi:MAG: L-threonine 3-dehydrogenase [Planctomycetes bacterium]|nr:L-threonine 3-dehydrogenase [Planctomycetota bacterium]